MNLFSTNAQTDKKKPHITQHKTNNHNSTTTENKERDGGKKETTIGKVNKEKTEKHNQRKLNKHIIKNQEQKKESKRVLCEPSKRGTKIIKQKKKHFTTNPRQNRNFFLINTVDASFEQQCFRRTYRPVERTALRSLFFLLLSCVKLHRMSFVSGCHFSFLSFKLFLPILGTWRKEEKKRI